jgi:hypothetical protein
MMKTVEILALILILNGLQVVEKEARQKSREVRILLEETNVEQTRQK